MNMADLSGVEPKSEGIFDIVKNLFKMDGDETTTAMAVKEGESKGPVMVEKTGGRRKMRGRGKTRSRASASASARAKSRRAYRRRS
jgi:hypothetical protein